MMRWVRYFLPFLIVQGGIAETAPSVPVVTAKSLFSSSPQEAAKLLGLGERRFVATTIYMNFPGGNVLRTVELFAQPEPILPGICHVDVFDVGFKPHQDGSPVDVSGTARFDIAKITQLHLFAVAKDLPSPANGASSTVIDSERCHQLVIETDMFSHDGAMNVFSASSPEDAQRGSRLFAAVISAAAAKNKSVGFKLTCEGRPREDFCVKPRDEIGAMDVRHFETMNAMDCTSKDDICYRVTGGGYKDSWEMDIIARRGRPNSEIDEITSVRFGITLNPQI
jgi:hypothetical protein